MQKLITNRQITWRKLLGSLFRNKTYVLAANICAIFSTLSRIAVPLLIPFLIDEVVLGESGSYLDYLNSFMPDAWQHAAGYLAVTFILATVLRTLALTFGILQSRLFLNMAKSSVCELRVLLLSHIEKISAWEYKERPSGEVVSYLTKDVACIEEFLGRVISEFIISILTIVGILCVILSMSAYIGLLIIILYPSILLLSKRLGLQLTKLKDDESIAVQNFQQDFVDIYSSLLQLRVVGRLHYYFDKLRNKAAEIRDSSFLYEWKKNTILLGSTEVFHSGLELILYCVLFAVITSHLTIGEMVGVSAFLWAMLTPFSNLLSLNYNVYSATGSLNRVNEVLAMDRERVIITPYQNNHMGIGQAPELIIDDVNFSYRDSVPIIQGLTLHIRAGEKVALIGPSGCGKSTLVALMLGLYRPNSGRILCAGIPLEQMQRKQLSRIVHGVMQESALLNQTVKENVTLGRKIPESHIVKILQEVGLSYLFERRGFTLDSHIGEGGLKLSGGERQRVKLASVILADPEIIILDEATSALDSKTDKFVQKMILSRFSNKTVIIVTHKPETLEGMDRIFEIGGSKIYSRKTMQVL